MKTADLISALAADTAPVRPARVMGPLAGACLLGALVTGVVLVTWLGLRPLGEAVRTSAFWMKAGYTSALALAGFLLTIRMARPAGRPGRALIIAVLAVLAMIGLSTIEMMRAGSGGMRPLMMGHTWSVDPRFETAGADSPGDRGRRRRPARGRCRSKRLRSLLRRDGGHVRGHLVHPRHRRRRGARRGDRLAIAALVRRVRISG